MTLTAWKRAVRAVESKGFARLQSGSEVRKHNGYYGTEYSLYAADGNCITVEYDLDKIKNIVVD